MRRIIPGGSAYSVRSRLERLAPRGLGRVTSLYMFLLFRRV